MLKLNSYKVKYGAYMSRIKLTKSSNPKELKDYMAMFNKIFRWHELLWATFDVLKEEGVFTDPEIVETIIKNNLEGYNIPNTNKYHKEKYPEYLKVNIQTYVLSLTKNNHIESFLKWYRAALCWQIRTLYQWLNSDKTIIDESQAIIILFDLMEKETKTLDKYWVDYYNNEKLKTVDYEYNNKNPMFLISDLRFTNIKHFIDVYNADKVKYKKIMDLSWDNKTPYYIEAEYEKLLNEINSSTSTGEIIYEGRDRTTYMELALKAEPKTEHYLNVGENLDWYIFGGYDSPFESFIGTQGYGEGTHCGKDSDSSVFFSLRSLNSKNQYVLHCTISAKIIMIPELDEGEIEPLVKGLPAVFELIQIKGRRNMPVIPKYWLALLKLFSVEEIGWQSQNENIHKIENNFNICWLINEQYPWSDEALEHSFGLNDKEIKSFSKMYENFLKSKPWWLNPMEAMKAYGVINVAKKVKIALAYLFTDSEKRPEYSSIDITPNSVDVHFKSFHEMLEAISQLNKDFAGLYKSIDETFFEYAPAIEDSDIEIFLEHLKEDDSMFYAELKKLVKAKSYESVLDLICNDTDYFPYNTFEAIKNAWYSGWEVGSSNEYYKQVKEYLDQYDLEDGCVGVFATILELNDSDWVISYDIKSLAEYNEDDLVNIEIPLPENTKIYIESGSEYDEEAAYERLREELPMTPKEHKKKVRVIPF